VVLDTNVLLGFYLSRSPESLNRRVIRLWRDQRRLQLVVTEVVVQEYLEVLRRVGVSQPLVDRLSVRLEQRSTVTWVRPGRRSSESRDPDDNMMLDAASSGRARYLVTHDHDLLDIPRDRQRRFRFEIVTPRELLSRLDE
jgi:putative PIN family toxin of toxin-antitoxin system